MTTISVHPNQTSLWRQFAVHSRGELKIFVSTPAAMLFTAAMPVIAYGIAGFANRANATMSMPFGSYQLQAGDRYYAAMMAFALFAAAFLSTAVGMGSRRLDGRFRRLRTTAANPVPVMAALLGTWFLVALASGAAITLLGTTLFGVQMTVEQSLRVLLCSLLGVVTYMMLGFAVSLFFRSTESAVPLANLIYIPLVFLSGIFYDIDLGTVGNQIVNLLPLRPLLTLLASGFGNPEQPIDVTAILVLLGWIAVSALVVLWRFRWASESEPRRGRHSRGPLRTRG